MRKIFIKSLFLFLIVGLANLAYPLNTFAQSPPFDCGYTITCVDPADCKPVINENNVYSGVSKVTHSFNLSKIPTDFWKQYPDANGDGTPDILESGMNTHPDSSAICINTSQPNKQTNSIITDDRTNTILSVCGDLFEGDDHSFHLKFQDASGVLSDLCVGSYKVVPKLSGSIKITSTNNKQDVDSRWVVEISNVVIYKENTPPSYVTYLDNNYLNNNYTGNYLYDPGDLGAVGNDPFTKPVVKFTLDALPKGTYTVSIRLVTDSSVVIASSSFTVLGRGTPTPTVTIPVTPSPTYNPALPSWTPIPPVPSLSPLCDQIDIRYREPCWNCINTGGIWTAIGCLPTNLEVILKDYVFVYGTGITGGIAFLYFIYGVFLILTSGGNPEKIAEGKEIIISALSGLFLIIFSVFLLRVIGYDILKIPGFG